jgi:hypothetical protein
VEASRGAAHHVLPRGMSIVGGAGLETAHAGVPVVNVAPMRMAVVPIFKRFIGVGGRALEGGGAVAGGAGR